MFVCAVLFGADDVRGERKSAFLVTNCDIADDTEYKEEPKEDVLIEAKRLLFN